MYKKLFINTGLIKNSFVLYKTTYNQLNSSITLINYKFSSASSTPSFFDQFQKKSSDNKKFDYDLFVIGGGSGGLSCARAAAKLGATVGLADFVTKSPYGSTWGLGGTCVNVGCIPKKLMHQSGLLGESRFDQQAAGWNVDVDKLEHSWEAMVKVVQKHIKKLNFGYKSSLSKEKVKYINSYATLLDKNTIQLKNSKNELSKVTAKYILVAVGTRPGIPEQIQKAKNLMLTSDDIFSQKKNPKKTLVVGASYVALECASFLTAFKNDTTVMVRSIILRGFDQQLANKIGDYMKTQGTKFLNGEPIEVKKLENGQLEVTYKLNDGSTKKEIFDTVLIATGREATTDTLNLGSVGVKVAKNKKVLTNEADQTNIENIYALGDCAYGRPELTPPAIQAGKLLAQRLFNKKKELMDYDMIPTSVFTALEYGSCGYSEEAALKKFGNENISVYHTAFKPLEYNYYEHHGQDTCYMKLIVNIADSNRVVGLHYFGPNAGEVTQGYAVAMKMGATKEDFDRTVGIHPTCSEEFTTLEKTKKEDPNATKGDCWG